jgi:hypothetical protein
MYVTNAGSNTVSVIGIISPIADAGPDQTVDSGATVQLDGTGSSANGGSPIVSYQWTQVSGPTVTLDDPTSATPSFTAPDTEVQENIVFEIVVTNEQGVESQPDSVTITVNPVIPPIADAGPDQTVDSGATVQLDGSGSSANGGSPIASYQWTQTSGPTVTLDDPTSATPSFTAPDTLVEENIVFELVVTNEQGVESQPDSVTITVNPVIPPIADAGPDLEGIIGSGNNINIQVQENSGNNAVGQSRNGQMYSDESIFQRQSTSQDSSVVS